MSGTVGRWAVFALCVILFLRALPAAHGQGADEDAIAVEDNRERYRIGFLRFASESLSLELEYLLALLPEAFSNEFARVNDHFYDDDEIRSYQRYLHRRRTAEVERQLADLLAAQDQRIFAADADHSAQDQQIADMREEIEELRQYDTTTIEIENPKPIEVANLLTEYPEQRPSYRSIVTAHDLDLVFDATVDQDSEFALLTVRYYSRSQDKIYSMESVSVAQDEISALTTLVNDRIADIIVGRDWSSVTVTGVRDQDAVYVDDMLIGYGVQTLRYVPLGDHTVRVESEYFERPEVQEVSLGDRMPITVQFSEDERSFPLITIDTVPPGAEVYVNSTWQGRTPLTIERTPAERTLLIRRPGYFDVRRPLNDATEEALTYVMTPELFDQGEWLFSRRDRFYASLAAFIISIPIPIILNGIHENSAAFQATSGYRSLSAAGRSTVDTTASIAQSAGYVGIFVSVTLAINTIIEAVKYVRAADFFHRL